MQSKIDNNLTVLEKKILFTLDDQNSVFEYMIKYIDQKTYGSYRTVSKNIKKVRSLLDRTHPTSLDRCGCGRKSPMTFNL